MARKSAVTKEIAYATERCDVCGDEVAVDDVPDDVIEPQGYAVLLGEGTVTREPEDEGNWDEAVQFELEKEASRLPSVSAFITCERCAEAVHGISSETPPYTGTLPSELGTSRQHSDAPDWVKGLVYVAGAVIFFALLLALL